MTARNVLARGTAGRSPSPDRWNTTSSPLNKFVRRVGPDLDAALLALPERDPVAVVLCHLQGSSRREAARERLGCAERHARPDSRALQKLRGRLGDELLAVLAIAVVATPASLAATTTRAAIIYLTST